jgi:putative protease
VDAYFAGDFSESNLNRWNKKLATVYNRGFWDGYYLGQKMGEWTKEYGSVATKRKEYVGKVNNYFSKIGVAEIKMETKALALGDEIQINGPTTGVYEAVISELRVDGKTVPRTVKGELCSLPTTSLVRRMDKVFRVFDADASSLPDGE